MTRRRALLWLAAVTLASPAWAADGVLEINAACVLTGCFPGDAPGFPVQTAANQSYVLTSSLTVPDANTTAIQLNQGSSLDLRGFAITGTTTCTGTPASCSAAGTGVGVSAQYGASIRNGTIRRMGSNGITGADEVRVTEMLLTENGGDGLGGQTGTRGLHITNNRIDRNGGDGIDVNAGGPELFVADNTIYGNAGYGILGSGFMLVRNFIHTNGNVGIAISNQGGLTSYGQNSIRGNNGDNANAQTNPNPLAVGVKSMGGNICGSVSC